MTTLMNDAREKLCSKALLKLFALAKLVAKASTNFIVQLTGTNLETNYVSFEAFVIKIDIHIEKAVKISVFNFLWKCTCFGFQFVFQD